MESVEKRALKWVANGETGISSETIWAVIMGVADPDSEDAWHKYDVPHDPSDFRRCRLLLDLIPEWRVRLHEVAELFPEWKPFVEAWNELDALYDEEKKQNRAPKLYDRMQKLRGVK